MILNNEQKELFEKIKFEYEQNEGITKEKDWKFKQEEDKILVFYKTKQILVMHGFELKSEGGIVKYFPKYQKFF